MYDDINDMTYLNGGHIHIEPPPCPSCTSAPYTAPSCAGSDRRDVASDWDLGERQDIRKISKSDLRSMNLIVSK